MNQILHEIYESTVAYFDIGVEFLVLLIEIIGTVVLVHSILSAVIGLIKKKEYIRLHLAEGIALALEFKVGGELLRTVIARDLEELLILGVVILLRAALTFLIQWEIRIEKGNDNMKK